MYREMVWTDESEDHIARHRVRPSDVEELVNSRPVYTAGGRDDTTLVYGETAAGRRLLVVLCETGDGRSARRVDDHGQEARRAAGLLRQY